MSLSALGVLIVSVITMLVAAVGVVFVYFTLKETKETVNVTREIGIAQTRAWIGFQDWKLWANGADGRVDQYVFTIIFANSGTTPGLEVRCVAGESKNAAFRDDIADMSWTGPEMQAPPNNVPFGPESFGATPEEIFSSHDTPIIVRAACRYKTIYSHLGFRYTDVSMSIRFIGRQDIDALKKGELSAGNLQISTDGTVGKMT